MKKICSLFLTFVIPIMVAKGNNTITPTFLTPDNVIQKEEEKQNDMIELTNLVENKEYEKAFTLLTSSQCETYLLNENMIEYVMDRYKKILTIKATAYLKNNQPDEALSILKVGEPYFLKDTEYQTLYHNAQYQTKKIDWVNYTGQVSNLSLFPLITQPKVNIGDTHSLNTSTHEDYLTPTEFQNILSALYNNNYILIDIYDIFSVTNTTLKPKTLYIPEGKIPLILTVENVVYNKEQKAKGTVDKLIVDRKQKLATYTSKKAIQDRVSYNDEFCTILETFINSHPDFSHNGARAIIGLTGEDGILGYRTQKTNANSRYDIKKALQVVTKLKKLGYRFASMGYSETSINTMNTLERNKNLYNWQEEVGKIVGATPIYLLPKEEDPSKEVIQSLQEYGYSLLIGNEPSDILSPSLFLSKRQ